ncbi:MerR family transcriptional regulator [Serpentinicella sp. ANB-PHB4]|uniref:MerR family transcriptional regulator n=1 Tax=Serpentinicella sp. ANB-PHB4 TaxID=3074076 RepID=UPI002861EA66|nr:MerR family transcriptional regulator [Serpentinicella sp. ANB-PHB4]MDR5658858.1 MerR family transcriptional regulator [Serpentinicella sp. ANB-PHB4]
MYKIGVFSKMNKITIKTLRHYDEIGLFKPIHVDEMTGYRYYSSSQLPRLYEILALKSIGFSLSEILNSIDQENNMVDCLEKKKDHILKKIEEEEFKLSQLRTYLKTLKLEGTNMKYKVIVKELPEVIVASMRTVIPDYDAYYKVYPEMGEYMEQQKVECSVPEYCFTIYHDGEYKESDIDVEICEAVTGYGKDSDKIKFKKIDKVDNAACVLHKGPYNTIGMAYGAVMKWIEENGYEVSDLPRESYIDGIWNKETSEEWLTEIQVPIIFKQVV